VPYRRGYLFYGPPGTGKTSMCLALAGHFKLELYTLSGTGVKDDELGKMFAALPPKCLILLEDIDSAGITRERMGEPKKKAHAARSGITLSGLLNAFDGTTSQEGRVLVLTSNTPDTLDRALVRPGRIDRQVYFGPVSRACARNIFLRMFASDAGKGAGSKGADAADQHPVWRAQPGVGEHELSALADRFAEQVPEARVSPAELQGFLLDHKRPAEAVERVGGWVREMLGAGEGIVEGERQEGKRLRERLRAEEAESESDSSDDGDDSGSNES
jgi:chaperone BCS1